MKNILFLILWATPLLAFTQNAKGLANKPPLGWNSYDSYGVYLHEKAAFENLEAFAQKLKPFGYEYFVIDGMWYGEYKLVPGTIYPAEREATVINIDSFGRVEPGSFYFPNGLKPLINKAHELGIKFGLHMMRGIPRQAVKKNLPVYGTEFRAKDIADTTSICSWNSQFYGVDMNKPGAQEYYNGLYKKLADWGVDFIKVDDVVPFPKEVVAIGKAIKNCGREIVYSLSPGDNTNLKDLPYYKQAQMLRITGDIWDNQSSIDRSFDAWKIWQGMATPGFWPDLDMVPFGKLQLMHLEKYGIRLSGRGFMRTSEFTQEQMRTFITQRALAASPVMISGDLPTIDDYSLALITNKDMLECNQNGNSSILVKEENGMELWLTYLPEKQIKGWAGYFNRTQKNISVTISKKELKLVSSYNSELEKEYTNDFTIKDIWNNKEYRISDGQLTFTIASGDVLFIRFEEVLH
nr:glycoside hydrolase family 27 protein [uncultured Draconibacterium sp.]